MNSASRIRSCEPKYKIEAKKQLGELKHLICDPDSPLSDHSSDRFKSHSKIESSDLNFDEDEFYN